MILEVPSNPSHSVILYLGVNYEILVVDLNKELVIQNGVPILLLKCSLVLSCKKLLIVKHAPSTYLYQPN